MDYDRIIGLLDKYWKCETTLPEEEELRYFYKHCRQMPEELAEYRELFIFQEGERQIGLGNDFDRKILASSTINVLPDGEKGFGWLRCCCY